MQPFEERRSLDTYLGQQGEVSSRGKNMNRGRQEDWNSRHMPEHEGRRRRPLTGCRVHGSEWCNNPRIVARGQLVKALNANLWSFYFIPGALGSFCRSLSRIGTLTECVYFWEWCQDKQDIVQGVHLVRDALVPSATA